MYIFIDEAGDLNFTESGSKFFILTAAVLDTLNPCNSLLDLRHEIEADGFPIPRGFHAKNDPKPLRNRVFQRLSEQSFEIHSVLLPKKQIYRALRKESYVYGLAARFLFNFLFEYKFPKSSTSRIVLPVYSAGKTKRMVEVACKKAIASASRRAGEQSPYMVAVWESYSHPGLQLVDYCSWAIQREKEAGDQYAKGCYAAIEKNIKSGFIPFLN